MTPADLVAAVRERLDETERLAKLASPGPWHLNAEGDEVIAVDGITVAEAFALSNNQQRNTAEHIAFHDPAAVLRQVAAARRVFERHQPYVDDDGQATCEHCPADYEDELTPWPCPDFADLADGLGIDLEEETG